MVNKIINYFKALDKLTYKIMKNGLNFCFAIAILSTLILFTYSVASLSPSIYYIGLSMFKLSCTFAVEFIICGLVMDSIKKQIV